MSDCCTQLCLFVSIFVYLLLLWFFIPLSLSLFPSATSRSRTLGICLFAVRQRNVNCITNEAIQRVPRTAAAMRLVLCCDLWPYWKFQRFSPRFSWLEQQEVRWCNDDDDDDGAAAVIINFIKVINLTPEKEKQRQRERGGVGGVGAA